jgi:hypothetical protein
MCVACTLIFTATMLAASGNNKYEVWSIDQSNSNGKSFGGTIHIWDGHDLEKMYIDSGAGSIASNPRQADLYAFPVSGYSASNPPNTPALKLVFREEVDPADAHGATLTRDQRYLWGADRGRFEPRLHVVPGSEPAHRGSARQPNIDAAGVERCRESRRPRAGLACYAWQVIGGARPSRSGCPVRATPSAEP